MAVRATVSGLTTPERLSVIAVLLAMAMVVLDATIINVALPVIADSLSVSAATAILAVTAYQTALVIGLLPSAHLAERFGYRGLFIGGLTVFSFGSAACAFAPSIGVLVAARALQGLGGAAIMSLGIALLRFALGAERLGAAIGWNAMTVALCSAAGPILGAIILSLGPWPWLFLIKLPIGVFALLAATALPRVKPVTRRVNIPGIVLHASTAMLVLAAAGLAIARPFLAASLVAAAISLAVFFVRRERSSPAPLWPIDLFARNPFRVAVAASVCCFTGQSAGLLALPFYLQESLGYDPVGAGLVISCWPVSVAVTSLVSNRLAIRFGSAPVCTAGGLVMAAGLALSALAPAQHSLIPLVLGALFCGLGFGLFQVPNNRTMFLSVSPERSAAAGGMQGTARLMGQTLGALILGLLFALASGGSAPRIGFGIGACFSIAAALVSQIGKYRTIK